MKKHQQNQQSNNQQAQQPLNQEALPFIEAPMPGLDVLWEATKTDEGMPQHIVRFADTCIEATILSRLDAMMAAAQPQMLYAEKLITRCFALFAWAESVKDKDEIKGPVELLANVYVTMGYMRAKYEANAEDNLMLVNACKELIGKIVLYVDVPYCAAMASYAASTALTLYNGDSLTLVIDLENRFLRLMYGNYDLPEATIDGYEFVHDLAHIRQVRSSLKKRKAKIDEQYETTNRLKGIFARFESKNSPADKKYREEIKEIEADLCELDRQEKTIIEGHDIIYVPDKTIIDFSGNNESIPEEIPEPIKNTEEEDNKISVELKDGIISFKQ